LTFNLDLFFLCFSSWIVSRLSSCKSIFLLTSFHYFCLFWMCKHKSFFIWYRDLFKVVYRSYLVMRNGNSSLGD
jgi:hypothetical protein